MVATGPGFRDSAWPHQRSTEAATTTAEIATCIAAGDVRASAQTPSGVAAHAATVSGHTVRHSTVDHTRGRRWMLASTSSIRMIGTTLAGGITSVRLVTQIIDEPNPV